MRNLDDTVEESLDPASLECLRRTRSGVLNVLVGVGVVVAVTGLVLRGRAEGALQPIPAGLRQTMLAVLIGIFVLSSILRRAMGGRARLRDPVRRGRRFYLAHVLPAAVGALAAPVGLVHGWLISPRLAAVLPFWLAALVLGILAYPRGRELDEFDRPMEPEGEPAR
jgi:hypothetical protein